MANPFMPNFNIYNFIQCVNIMEFTLNMFTSKVNIFSFIFPFVIN